MQPNQNPEQIACDKIDAMLVKAGGIIPSKDKINLVANKGVGQPLLSMGIIKRSTFLFLSLSEQHQINQQIESRLSICDKVEKTIVENIHKAEALRQSILKKAFAGKLLTETEIIACKKSTDWEPAGELLKRIKKEKTN